MFKVCYKYRASAQAQNPYAGPDDVALLVAYFDNQCVGYFGLMPGLLICNRNFCKVFWATTFFVSPELRSQGVGSLILKEVKNLKIDFVVTGITKSAKRAFERVGFRNLGVMTYYQIQISKNHFGGPLLAKSHGYITKNLQRFRTLSTIVGQLDDSIKNYSKKTFYRILQHREQKKENDFYFRQVDQIRTDIQKQTLPLPAQNKFYRGIEAINWMLKHPWVSSKNKEKEDISNYYFTSFRDLFKYVAFEIYSTDGKSFKGFIVLSISRKKSNTIVKLLDFYFLDPEDFAIAGYMGLKYAHSHMADVIECPECLLGYFKNKSLLKPLIKRRKRLYLFQPKSEESPLAISTKDINMSYCDADTAFT